MQTNEIRRSAALLGGLLTFAGATGLPLRLLEIGSSAGLNLCWDRYRYELAGCDADTPPAPDASFVPLWGAPDAAVVVRSGWHGNRDILSRTARVAARAGCDIAPIDLADPAQARTLESFVWPDHPARLAQLRAAIAAVRRDPPSLTRRAAADWLDEQLASSPSDVATVVFHSIMWWYLSEPERQRVTAIIAAAGTRATRSAPLAWLRLEVLGSPCAELRLSRWPDGAEQTLARADTQGRWVNWLA